jgi:hypothetical protein
MQRSMSMFRVVSCVGLTAIIVAGSAGAVVAQEVGVPACDSYLSQYEACINSKVPESLRAHHRTEVDNWRKRWIDYGNKNPSLKSSLDGACKNAMMLSSVVVEQFGCTMK